MRRYALLASILVVALAAGVWENFHVKQQNPAPFQIREAETILSLYPNHPIAHFTRAKNSLFYRFDVAEARQHMDRALASQPKTDERIYHENVRLLILERASQEAIDAGCEQWKYYFPDSELEDPRTLYANTSVTPIVDSQAVLGAVADGMGDFAGVYDDRFVVKRIVQQGGRSLRIAQHNARIWAICLADSATLISAAADGTVAAWDWKTGQQQQLVARSSQPITSVAANDQLVAAADRQGKLYLWSRADWKSVDSIAQHRPISALALSPDGKSLVTGDWSGTVRVWPIQDGKISNANRSEPLHEWTCHRGVVNSLQFSSDGARLLSGSRDMTARITDFSNGQSLHHLKGEHTGPVLSAVFSRDHQSVFTGGADGKVAAWDASEGTLKGIVGRADSPVYSLGTLANGRQLVCGIAENGLELIVVP